MSSARRQFAATVLVCEALVVGFAMLVAFGLKIASPRLVLGGGAVLAVACLVAAGLLRTPAGYVLGSLVQIPMVAAGLLIPAMWAVGGIFAALWIAAIVVGGRIDRERAAYHAQNPPEPDPRTP